MTETMPVPRRAPRWVAGVVAVVAPGLATLVALWIGGEGRVVPALLYLLAVVIAGALGRMWSGLLAAALSFLGLNFYFTPPVHTLRVEKTEDWVALLVFLSVSAVIGTLFTFALQERARAQRREEEAAMVNRLTLGIRSGDSVGRSLEEFGGAVVDLFDLEGCTIRAATADGELEVQTGAVGVAGTQRLELPLTAGGRDIGTLTVERSSGSGGFLREERDVLAGIAGQTVLALERARLDSEVHRARLDAEANQARAALFSSVTHDLRTPLASIKAGVSSLLQEDVEFDEAQRRDLLETVLEETDRLNRLVGNLMDLSRMRAGALQPQRSSVSLVDVIEAVLARMRPQLSAFSVRTVIRPDLPDAQVDPMQMDQVMTNILENAIRFAPDHSEITVSVARWRSSLQVRVSDHGPGIAEEEREAVFEAFHSGSGPHSGAGLGLAIAKAIVELHGGKIRAEPSPGGGASIVFEVPIEVPARGGEG